MSKKKERMKSEDVDIMTPEFRVSFPNVFEAVKVNPTDAKAKFGLTAVFQVAETEKSKKAGTKIVSIEGLKELCRNVALEKYGPREKWPAAQIGADDKGQPIWGPPGSGVKFPFRLGTEPKKSAMDGFGEGTVFITLQSVNMPGIVESFAGPDGKPAPLGAKTDFYPGCYARAKVNAYWWSFMGKEGVSLGLGNIQKLRDGERFGGGANAADEFAPIDVPAGAAAPVAQKGDPLGV